MRFWSEVSIFVYEQRVVAETIRLLGWVIRVIVFGRVFFKFRLHSLTWKHFLLTHKPLSPRMTRLLRISSRRHHIIPTQSCIIYIHKSIIPGITKILRSIKIQICVIIIILPCALLRLYSWNIWICHSIVSKTTTYIRKRSFR